jgi:hypothetical protein
MPYVRIDAIGVISFNPIGIGRKQTDDDGQHNQQNQLPIDKYPFHPHI